MQSADCSISRSSFRAAELLPDTACRGWVLAAKQAWIAFPARVLLIRRSDYERLQGFDEEFFCLVKTLIYVNALSELGRETWFIPAARITHIGGHSMRQVKETANYEFYRAMRIYMSKHWQHLPRFTYKTIDMGIGFRAWLEKFIGH